ncbi:MAG: (2Fe-2S)-binding protein [Candidatus Eremiobacterota bacterium]
MTTISLKVNGRDYKVHVDDKTILLDVLREKLNLTGAKNGCGQGACGTCTVVMDGEAVRSCIVKAIKADGKEIVTIEGLTDGVTLHPIQDAFIKAGAVQCGFCTPGYIMSLYALFNKNPDAPDEEIKKILEKHLCRCTGYETIWEAAKLAQKMMKA